MKESLRRAAVVTVVAVVAVVVVVVFMAKALLLEWLLAG